MNKKIIRVLAICLAAAAICSGCQKNEEESKINTDVANTSGNYSDDAVESTTERAPGEVDTVTYGEDAVSADGEISCKIENIRQTGTVYDDSNTELYTAYLTITNNSDEKLEPDYLVYFRVLQDGESVGAFSLTTDIAAARDEEDTFFPDGIEAGETVTSKIYMELPQEFEELEFVYYPYSTDPSDSWAQLTLGTTFTKDDVLPAE